MKKNKILVIYNYFSTNKGSYSNRYYELSKIWIKKGYNVEFITAPYFKSDIRSKNFFEVQYIDNIKLNIINFPDGGNKTLFKRIINSIGFIFCASFLSLFKKYDMLICSSGPFTIGIPNIINILFKKNGIKVFETRDIWPQSGIEYKVITNRIVIYLSYLFEKIIYKYSNFIVTLSEGQKKNIIDRFPAYSHKIKTIPQICNKELFDLKIENSTIKNYNIKYGKIFTYIGGLGPIHNVSYWIKLFFELNKINKEKFTLIIIGKGPDKINLEKLARKLNLNNVYFMGQVSKNKIPFWLKLSYATLFSTTNLPIQQTCSPNKVFDSFSAGIPLIQTSNGWIKDFIKKNNSGISIEVGNIKISANLVSEYIKDVKLRNLHAKNSLKISTQFDKELLAYKYLNLLKC